MSRVEGDREELIRFFFFENDIILVNLKSFVLEGGNSCMSELKIKN